MGADADQDQPFRLLARALIVGLRIAAGRRALTSCAALISSGVRWRMKTGLPRHVTVIAWPASIGDRSTSIVRQRQRVGRRVHLVDERPGRRGDADGGHRAGGEIEEIAPGAAASCWPLMARCVRYAPSFPPLAERAPGMESQPDGPTKSAAYIIRLASGAPPAIVTNRRDFRRPPWAGRRIISDKPDRCKAARI